MDFQNMSPAQIQETFRQRMLENYREQLEIKDDAEWQIIESRISKVLQARTEAAADGAGEWCLQLLALAVLPAVLEEALFRGVVLQTLLDSGSRFGAWLLTTLFFSLLHGNLAALPAHLLFGGALTLAEMRTGNLLVPMVMHAVYNASALFWRGMSAGWLIFCGAAVLALGIWALMTLPRTAKMRMKRGHIMLSAAILLLMAVQYLL